jgi:hypothetical protein
VNYAKWLTSTAKSALKSLDSCGSSEAAAVAECLGTIAENDEEQAQDEYLAGCAAEIAGYALRFITDVGQPLDDDTVKLLLTHLLRAKTPEELTAFLDQQARTSSMLMDEKFARVAWSAGDVQSLFDVNDAEAVTFLQNNEKHIQDRLVELGWGVLETLGSIDGLKRTEPDDEDPEDNEPPQDVRVEG